MKIYLVGSLALLLSVLPFPAHGSGLVLYDDALQNGWENYSWATVSLQVATPARGASSIRVDAQPYEALYFPHAAIDISAYEAFSFWLYLGAASPPPSVVVQAVLENGTEGPVVSLTAAGTYEVRASSSVGNFQPIIPVVVEGPVSVSADYERVKVADIAAIDDPAVPKRFLRIFVSLP